MRAENEKWHLLSSPVGELTEQLTDLALQKRGVCGVTGRGHTLVPCLPPVPTSSYPHHARRPLPTHSE